MRTLLLMASFLSVITRLFGNGEPGSRYKTVEIYDRLRSRALTVRAEQVGAKKEDQVLAILMEMGTPEAVATLVAVVDGAASLYLSSGGGIIGAGEDKRPNAASRKLIRMAASFLKYMTKAEKTPLPREGFARFYVVTPSGLLTTEVKEEDLGGGRHALSPLFQTAHELITEIRLIDEQRGKKG
ncbi:MAG: hypothetical protein L0Z50_17040 [Verrucomicrobiales bacterium]|nr:hypothetical protein [Verrucomicrobiales bacterium]